MYDQMHMAQMLFLEFHSEAERKVTVSCSLSLTPPSLLAEGLQPRCICMHITCA